MDDRPIRAWAIPRARMLATAGAAGVAIGLLVTLGLSLADGSRSARATGFALGALALGVGTLGWSGSVMAGRGIENLQRHLDATTDWTERDSRRAMTRVGGFGLGVMVGASLVPSL